MENEIFVRYLHERIVSLERAVNYERRKRETAESERDAALQLLDGKQQIQEIRSFIDENGDEIPF